jgi:hypothetical protein
MILRILSAWICLEYVDSFEASEEFVGLGSKAGVVGLAARWHFVE